MPKYVLTWTENTHLSLEMEAPSKLVALDKFYNGEYDVEDVSDTNIEFETDSLEIEEV